MRAEAMRSPPPPRRRACAGCPTSGTSKGRRERPDEARSPRAGGVRTQACQTPATHPQPACLRVARAITAISLRAGVAKGAFAGGDRHLATLASKPAHPASPTARASTSETFAGGMPEASRLGIGAGISTLCLLAQKRPDELAGDVIRGLHERVASGPGGSAGAASFGAGALRAAGATRRSRARRIGEIGRTTWSSGAAQSGRHAWGAESQRLERKLEDHARDRVFTRHTTTRRRLRLVQVRTRSGGVAPAHSSRKPARAFAGSAVRRALPARDALVAVVAGLEVPASGSRASSPVARGALCDPLTQGGSPMREIRSPVRSAHAGG